MKEGKINVIWLMGIGRKPQEERAMSYFHCTLFCTEKSFSIFCLVEHEIKALKAVCSCLAEEVKTNMHERDGLCYLISQFHTKGTQLFSCL
jgi:hypothetical protein